MFYLETHSIIHTVMVVPDRHSPRSGSRVWQRRKVWIVGIEVAKHGQLVEVPRHVAVAGVGIGLLDGVADSKHCSFEMYQPPAEQRKREGTSVVHFPTADRYKKSLV